MVFLKLNFSGSLEYDSGKLCQFADNLPQLDVVFVGTAGFIGTIHL